jgi:uncharacterized protein YraI
LTAATVSSAALAASPAVATHDVNLRAGPGTAYPAITTVPAGAPITAFGCDTGYYWCDVAWGPNRGWMSASYIQVVYAGRPVIVTPAVAPSVRLNVVAFDYGYWQAHYAGRPWYGHWAHYHRPAPGVRRAGGVVCGPEACRYGVVRRGPHGTVVRYGRIERP